MKYRHVIIPIFVPHKGCPHDCIFCNQKKISGQLEELKASEIPKIIEEHLHTIPKDAFVEIAFFGGSFTAIDNALQMDYLRMAEPFLKSGRVSEIRLSTRPDSIDEEGLNMLLQYGVKTIELGVQSMDEEVLKASLRGHDAECVFKASALIKAKGFKLGIQTMTGLPKDTYQRCIETAKKVISMKPDFVRIYPVLVIKGTELERQFRDGTYTPQKLDEAVDLCAELLELYNKNDINVIRIGLQITDNINEGSESEVASGPIHSAFRQLVESKLALRKIEELLRMQDIAEVKNLIIKTGKSNISNVIGQKRSNINYLQEKYNISTISVEEGANLAEQIILKFAVVTEGVNMYNRV